jgi:hypothetical protein
MEQLARHGIQPTERTPPALVHEFVSDLYRYELRRLRDRLMKKEFPKPEYYGRVVELRKRYWLISTPPGEWLVDTDPIDTPRFGINHQASKRNHKDRKGNMETS